MLAGARKVVLAEYGGNNTHKWIWHSYNFYNLVHWAAQPKDIGTIPATVAAFLLEAKRENTCQDFSVR